MLHIAKHRANDLKRLGSHHRSCLSHGWTQWLILLFLLSVLECSQCLSFPSSAYPRPQRLANGYPRFLGHLFKLLEQILPVSPHHILMLLLFRASLIYMTVSPMNPLTNKLCPRNVQARSFPIPKSISSSLPTLSVQSGSRQRLRCHPHINHPLEWKEVGLLPVRRSGQTEGGSHHIAPKKKSNTMMMMMMISTIRHLQMMS